MHIYQDRLVELRKSQNWTQEELAIAAGVSSRTVQRVERDGKASLETVRALAVAFDISVDDLKKMPDVTAFNHNKKKFKSVLFHSLWISTASIALALTVFLLFSYTKELGPIILKTPPVIFEIFGGFGILFMLFLVPFCFLTSTIQFMRQRCKSAKANLFISFLALSGFGKASQWYLNDNSIQVDMHRIVIFAVVYSFLYSAFTYFECKDAAFKTA